LLSEPIRIGVFDCLRDAEATVHQLAGELVCSQQNVSKHLALLADGACSLGARRPDAATGPPIRPCSPLCEHVCGSVE
jgi:hypothetical protein